MNIDCEYIKYTKFYDNYVTLVPRVFQYLNINLGFIDEIIGHIYLKKQNMFIVSKLYVLYLYSINHRYNTIFLRIWVQIYCSETN